MTDSDKDRAQVRDNPNMAAEAAKFLERDFDQCFAQMRHYDMQALSLVKFMFAAYTALIGVAAGLHQFSIKENTDLRPVAIVVLAVGFLVGVMMFCLVVRIRVYFVAVARYINEHRKFFLAAKPLGFENSTRMYTSTVHPQYFNWRSSDAFYIYVLSALNSILLTALALAVTATTHAIIGGAICGVVHIAGAVSYLKTREEKSIDRVVFGGDAGGGS